MKPIDNVTYELFELIPVYPQEIYAYELADKLGISTERASGIIIASSSNCLIAESKRGKGKKLFTYPDKKSKEKTLEFLRNGGEDEDFE